MSEELILRRRIRRWTWILIGGLVVSGATALPLTAEVELLISWLGLDGSAGAAATSEWGRWLLTVREALQATRTQYPFLFYGTDWLAFGHFVIALAFVGALREPVRNRWLFDFGLIACVMVLPFALIFGGIRDIPLWWRLIDCCFGVLGAIPLWLCRRWARDLESLPQP